MGKRAAHLKGIKRHTLVPSGSHFCEPVLWVPWIYHGTMKAIVEVQVVAVNSKSFRTVTQNYPGALQLCADYAMSYVRKMTASAASPRGIWDISPELIEELSEAHDEYTSEVYI